MTLLQLEECFMGFPGKRIAKSFLILLPAILAAGGVSAWNHSELDWKTIDTEHFSIHFHEGVEASAFEIARIVEEIYLPITTLYDYRPDKVHIHITDRAGLPEGAAYYYLNRIDIDTDDVDFHLRGNADWLRNVITHEFTHMVSLQSSMKMPRWMPAIYLQAFNFEKEKRPDVITGYPNFTGSLPLSGESVPNWFAEGVAQYQARGARYDIWDSHRDMVLRMASLDDRLLTLDQMGVFGKSSADAELLYNQGYSIVRYIAANYGEDKIGMLTAAHGKLWRTGFGGASKAILGISEGDLYGAWKDHVYTESTERTGRIVPGREGSKEAGDGFFNYSPVPDGEGGLYYLSNRGRDYRDVDLVHREANGEEIALAADLSSGVSISPDGDKLYYSRKSDDNKHGYEFNDIYFYDLKAGKEDRLTSGLKAIGPACSPDGTRVAFIITGDGFSSVAEKRLDDGEIKMLTPDVPCRRYTGLSWSQNGLLAARFDGTSRDIVLIDPETALETVLVDTDADERDPYWSADGSGFFYSSDRTGIFNVYYRDIGSGTDRMVTDVEGSAFQASEDGNDLLFAAFARNGYEIRRLADWSSSATAPDPDIDQRLLDERVSVVGDRTRDLSGDTLSVSGNYKVAYTIPFIFPRVMVFDNKFRIGFAIDSRDYLDRQSVYAAADASFDGEFNLQLGAEFRQLKPTFSFDLLRMRKYWEINDPNTGDITYRYDLWDAYFTCKLEFEQETLRRRNDMSIRYNHGEYGVNINAWESVGIELGWNYYKADEIGLMYDYRSIKKGIESNINPRGGRKLHLEGSAVQAKLSSGDFEYSFQPLYNDNDFMRYRFMYEEYLPLPFWAHALTVYVRGGWIDREEIDDFFYLYLGSRDGLRGYSYYSIGGTKNAMGRVTYRFPIWRNIDQQIPGLYFQSLYAAVFAEAGKAWNENTFDIDNPRTGAGYEVRLSGFTFFAYPLAVTFMGAYGFDAIEFDDPFVEGLIYTEGQTWRYYGSVLFAF
jgi:hypothetical protein